MSYSFVCVVVGLVLSALDRLGDPLDAPQPRVPGRPDRGQLGHRAGELRVVDPVAHLATGGRDADQAGAVEHAEMLRDRLARHRQVLAEARGRSLAIGQEQVEHPTTRGVPDRRPEVVVHGDRHDDDTSRATYSPRRGMK